MVALSDNMRGAFLMVVAMAAFTINDAAMKAVALDLPLYQAIFLRGVLTMLALAAIGHAMGGLKLRMGGRDTLVVGLRTIGEVGSTILFLNALRHMPLANLSAIMQSLPLAVTLAAAVVFREKVGWRRMLAIVIGFAGVLIIVRPGAEGFDIWALAGLGAVVFVVLRDMTTRSLSSAVPSVTVAFYAATSVTVMALAVVPFEGWEPVSLAAGVEVTAAAAFLIMGYLFIVMATRVGDVAIVAPFRYTSLVWAIGLGWVGFGDFPDGWTMTGAAIVIATGVYTFYRERRLAREAALSAKAGAPS